MTSRTDASGNVTSYGYDSLRRLSQITRPPEPGGTATPVEQYVPTRTRNAISLDAIRNSTTQNPAVGSEDNPALLVVSGERTVSTTDANGNTVTFTPGPLRRRHQRHHRRRGDDLLRSGRAEPGHRPGQSGPRRRRPARDQRGRV